MNSSPAPFNVACNPDLFSTEVNRVANETCRSLTIYADGRPQRPHFNDDGPVGVGLALELASVPDRLPNLRHISITHTDWAHVHIFQHMRLSGFPPQATHLSLTYAFTDASRGHISPLSVDNALAWTYRPIFGRTKPASAPGLRHLALSGVPTPMPGLLLRHVCTHVETLELTRPLPGQLPALVPLPPSVRTLVLRYPGTAPSKREMVAWLLPVVLKREIFPPLAMARSGSGGARDLDVPRARPRIVVRSGTPDPVLFIELWRECRRYDVELVYERDDSRGPVAPPGARREALGAYTDGPSPLVVKALPYWKEGRPLPGYY
uniref:N/A n=1 Tax=Ganoderma boninense TaxID=34458 RepID=A0A5K1K1R7_9APHY|nr:N/A [Ganoderma boninense]